MEHKKLSKEEFDKLRTVKFVDHFGKQSAKTYKLVRVGKVWFTLAFWHNEFGAIINTYRGQCFDENGLEIKRKNQII